MSVRKFTDSLYELYAGRGLSLIESLEIIAGRTGERQNPVKRAAQEILSSLSDGSLFSNALKSCISLNFDRTYITFIAFSERSGDLKDTISFLHERCRRRQENFLKLLEAMIYPAFVVALSVAACIFLFIYGNDFVGKGLHEQNFFDAAQKIKLIKALSWLFIFCVIVFSILKKNMGENKLYEAFLATGFLINAGVNVASAVGLGMLVLGEDSKFGRAFSQAREKLEFGMNLETAFSSLVEGKGRRMKEAFYYAQKAGGKADVFEKMALWINACDEKKRNMCLRLIEPLFVAATGIFLLILMVNILMPVMNDINLF